MSSKVYCSIGNVPKNKKRGSMKECIEKKQIRYYGIKKVDSKLVASVLKSKKNQNNIEKIKLKEITLSARLKKIKTEYDKENKRSKSQKNEKKINELKGKYNKLADQINELRIILSK